MSEYEDKMKKFRGSLRQWERIRHPWAGVVRVVLVVTLPFVLWSHSPLEIIPWIVIALFHSALFPVYVVAGKEAPILTRLTDVVEHWYEMTVPDERKMDIFPCAVMALPLFCSLWLHILFWGAYFHLAALACIGIFLHRQLHRMEQREEDQIKQMEHMEHVEQEEIEHA